MASPGGLEVFGALITFVNFVAACFLLGLIFFRSIAGGSLVLRSFELHSHPTSIQSDVIHVVGRRAGLISYFLTLLGLSSTCTFRVTHQYAEFVDSSLFGKTHAMVPLQHVVCVRGGVARPLLALFFVGLFLINGFLFLIAIAFELAFAILSLAFFTAAGSCLVYYFLRKKFFVLIRSEAGTEIAISFMPSVLEGQTVDFPKALMAVEVLKNLALDALHRTPPTTVAPAFEETPAYPVEDQSQVSISPRVTPPPLTPEAVSPISTGPEPPPSHEPEPEEVFSPQDPEEVAMKALREAVKTYNNGQHEEGIYLLQEVVRLNPGTKAARIAEKHLAKLGRHA